jgi:Phosphoinositide phospholipase C, Ca2+-dependent
LFVASDEISPVVAFLSLLDPQNDGARIARAVQAGFMAITRADAQTREARENGTQRRDAAFSSGAQIVQTNFSAPDPAIGPYRVSLADNPEAMCGERLAPEGCVRFQEVTPPVRAIATALP